ncbi:MAG: peptidase U32 family protein [Bacilli bacterium]
MIKPELLAPAGDLEKLKIAILYGADAIFIGGREYGLRANASNFSVDEIKEACEFAHSHGAKVYVTTNIFFHNENLTGFDDYIITLTKIGVDAFICADIFAINKIRNVSNVDIHLSTQQSVMNSYGINFFKKLGVTRIVLARECNLDEIKLLQKRSNMELEVFIHGSMCIGFSGRCMLSNHMTARDANRGGCSQNCRWEYDILIDEDNVSDKFGRFSMNPDDLSQCTYIKELCDINISSLKIEGRMRSIYYIANVVNVYRTIIDKVYVGEDINLEYYQKELFKSANRNISPQYLDGIPSYIMQNFGGRDESPSKDFCGLVIDYKNNMLVLEQRNYFEVGEVLEFIRPKQCKVEITVLKMFNSKMKEIDVARHPQEIIYIPCEVELFEGCIARRKENGN